MSGFHRALLLLVPLFVACSGEPPPETRLPGQAAPEGILGGLFGGIGEGKFDSAGHPLGAQVFQAGAACRPSTGAVEVEGWGAWPALHEPGSLCDVPLKRLGIGVFTANLRVLTQVSVADSASPSPVLLTLRVLDAQGEELGRKGISAEDFRAPLTYRNVWVSFTHRSEGPVRFEVSWSGGHPVRLSYLELFRRAPGVRIEPASGLAPQGEVQIEGRYPLSQSALSLSCGDVKLDGTLAALVDAGRARRDKGDFRTLITAPAGELLGACDLPTRLRARLKRADWILAASRVTYRARPAPCEYQGAGELKVLLTAFEPFPAEGTGENSSQAAVQAFDAMSVPGIRVARVILPVEWDSAGAMVQDLVQRCRPDIVIGFGQGRGRVEPETVAFNRQDTSDLAGGVPDNRGFVRDGEEIVVGAPPRYGSALPIAAITNALRGAGIDTSESADAGRYICNEVFYRIMHAVEGSAAFGGFVHLPRQYVIDTAARRLLAEVVRIVVQTTVTARAQAAKSSTP